MDNRENMSLLDKLIHFFLANKVITFLLLGLLIVWGILVSPFDWQIMQEFRSPVPVDAIPDIGENQQIVFTEWPGRSPQDVEDQVSYPLTVSLLGVPGVKTVRSYSMLGFSTVYIIFDEHVDFYWSRSRVLEKLNSLAPGTLPADAKPVLGPDATALGQVFWYTLEGRTPDDKPAGGWDLQELRSIQDYHVRYALMGVPGVSEVASVGGFVNEYQIDVNPDAIRSWNLTLEQVLNAVRNANRDVSAKTIEVNQVEYVIRGVGLFKQLSDMKNIAIPVKNGRSVYLKEIASISRGPAMRRGALDKEGAEAVGGVVVVRYGDNPMRVIQNVKDKITEIADGLPVKTLDDGTQSKVTIVPFYDRSGLIKETLGTLSSALVQQILVTTLVIILMIMHLRSSALISALLPVAVLMTFIVMKLFHVDANIVALSGIAIAIGTMVDMGIVVMENIVRYTDQEGNTKLETLFNATREVGGAVITAVMTTIISFLPVFTMQAAEGKLFRPLAFTKTFALGASILIAIFIIPSLAHVLFSIRSKKGVMRHFGFAVLALAGLYVLFNLDVFSGIMIILLALLGLLKNRLESRLKLPRNLVQGMVLFAVVVILARDWLPLGAGIGTIPNILFTALIIGGAIWFFMSFIKIYPRILDWALANKLKFLITPLVLTFMGLLIWLGFGKLFGWLPRPIKTLAPVSAIAHAFPGLGSEFMPPLDEGAFLLMPTTMPHASIGEVMDMMRKQDMAIRQLPEVSSVVGKLGRVDSPLDPAPISMVETVINYYSEYLTDENEKILKFRYNPDSTDVLRNVDNIPVMAADGETYRVRGIYLRDENSKLVPDRFGKPFRIWRQPLDPSLNPGRDAWPGINSPDDIWSSIVDAARVPGMTSAPKLQPISARIVMLQSGMRAPMGVKVKGPDLETIEAFSLELESLIKQVPSVRPNTVQADRIVGKPYLEIDIDREKLAQYGIKPGSVQNVIETAIGGKMATTTIEGRERYPVRIRYMRELRDSIEELGNILVPVMGKGYIPLKQVAEVTYRRGPQMIKSEDTFLVGYVIFDKIDSAAEVDVVQQVQKFIRDAINKGDLSVPAGVSYTFAGQYENQVRASKRLSLILPLVLVIIFLVLYLKFKSVITSLIIFSGITVAWSGGFIMLWLYSLPGFLDVNLLGLNPHDIFNIHPVNLSVAVWVGFLALFGIASDDGVIIATYLQDQTRIHKPTTKKTVRKAAMQAGLKRIRPCMMTTATTLLALMPVLMSTGRGSDIMAPMAIPVFGGMVFAIVSVFMVPVLYAWVEEKKLLK